MPQSGGPQNLIRAPKHSQPNVHSGAVVHLQAPASGIRHNPNAANTAVTSRLQNGDPSQHLIEEMGKTCERGYTLMKEHREVQIQLKTSIDGYNQRNAVKKEEINKGIKNQKLRRDEQILKIGQLKSRLSNIEQTNSDSLMENKRILKKTIDDNKNELKALAAILLEEQKKIKSSQQKLEQLNEKIEASRIHKSEQKKQSGIFEARINTASNTLLQCANQMSREMHMHAHTTVSDMNDVTKKT